MENQLLYDPSQHPQWLPPHSIEWYSRLAREEGIYKYPWKSEFDEPNAETIFANRISSYLTSNSRILDVGCGDGEFAIQFSLNSRQIIGIDIIDGFIETANRRVGGINNLQFLKVNVDDGLPFPDKHLDVVYTKKGPWLFAGRNREGHRVIKHGGVAMAFLHMGSNEGLRDLFPGLYSYEPASKDVNYIEAAERELNLSECGLTDVDIQHIAESEYLSTPEDVLIKKCFGQNETVKEFVWKECLGKVEEIFHRHATPKGLRVINHYCTVVGKAL